MFFLFNKISLILKGFPFSGLIKPVDFLPLPDNTESKVVFLSMLATLILVLVTLV